MATSIYLGDRARRNTPTDIFGPLGKHGISISVVSTKAAVRAL